VQTPFNDQWVLERAPQRRALREAGAAATHNAAGIPGTHLRGHVQKRSRWALALSKHPRWIDRDT
jgi:hypothetical protein